MQLAQDQTGAWGSGNVHAGVFFVTAQDVPRAALPSAAAAPVCTSPALAAGKIPAADLGSFGFVECGGTLPTALLPQWPLHIPPTPIQDAEVKHFPTSTCMILQSPPSTPPTSSSWWFMAP